jgi:hypothetical protein
LARGLLHHENAAADYAATASSPLDFPCIRGGLSLSACRRLQAGAAAPAPATVIENTRGSVAAPPAEVVLSGAAVTFSLDCDDRLFSIRDPCAGFVASCQPFVFCCQVACSRAVGASRKLHRRARNAQGRAFQKPGRLLPRCPATDTGAFSPTRPTGEPCRSRRIGAALACGSRSRLRICAQVAILDRVTSSVCLSEPEDSFLGATDPCAGRPMNPRSGSSDECRKSSQRPTTACVRSRAWGTAFPRRASAPARPAPRTFGPVQGGALTSRAGNLAPSRGLGRMDVEQLALVHNAGDCDSSGLALLCVEQWRLPNDVESCCGSGAS